MPVKAEVCLPLRWSAISARRCAQSRLRLNLAAVSSKHVAEIERWCRISGIAIHQDAIEALGFGNRCRSTGTFPVVACTRTKPQGLTSASNPKLITHLADFSVQEVNFEHIF